MKAVVIAVPDGDPEDYANFVAYVASQLAEGHTSGHVNSETYWSIEEAT
jgi:hypothetical protein